MKTSITMLFLIFSFILLSCSSSDLSRDYNSTFDFTTFDTYKIVKEIPKGPGGSSMPSATFNLIKSAVDLEMARKGFGRNNELADFGIAWHTALNDEVYDNVDDLGDWQKAFSKSDGGMLIIDIIYLETGNVVWRGWEKSVLSSKDLEEKINEAVAEILEPFPPKSIPTGN